MQKFLRTDTTYAINGGFFWIDKGKVAHSLNLLFVDGKQVQAGVYSRFGIYIGKNGDIKFQEYKWDKDQKHFLGGSPKLIKNGKIEIDGTFPNSKDPRSAIGQTKDGSIVLLTVDGRKKNFAGVTLKELAETMLSIGCVNAIALDGGGSSRLLINGTPLNTPTENRPVNNAIICSIK